MNVTDVTFSQTGPPQFPEMSRGPSMPTPMITASGEATAAMRAAESLLQVPAA
jgi:hypothetical protein